MQASRTHTRKPLSASRANPASESAPFRVTDWPMHYLLMIERQHMANSNHLLKRFGIDHRIWRLLVHLAETDGSSVSELADRGSFERTTLSKIADQAQRRGLVARVIETHDRRRSKLVLTSKGRQMIEQCKPTILGLFDRYFSGLAPKEFDTLMALLIEVCRKVQLQGVLLRRMNEG